MRKRTKPFVKKIESVGGPRTMLDPRAALEKIKGVAKPNESFDIAIRLGVNTRKADQNIRGTTVLPKGTGKTPRVLVFAKGEKIQEAEAAGADYAGGPDLIEKIKGGWLEFDVAIATPDVMKEVAQLGKILGTRGLMPNPKSGTVSFDITGTVKEFKAGKVEYRADKTSIVHTTIGRAGFSVDDLMENLSHLMNVIIKARPASLKGQYIKSVYVSTTQSPSVKLDPGAFTK
jgi:large subunit ribosomal protein L1